MDSGKIEKYLQTYIDDVIEPKINDELIGSLACIMVVPIFSYQNTPAQ